MLILRIVMKKGFVSISCFLLLSVGQLSAQNSPPPLYETEEELPKDLAIEKLPPKKKPTPPPQQPPAQPQETPPAEIKPAETVTQPEPKTEPEEKIKVEAKEVEIKPVVEPPPQPEITVPEDVPVVSPTPAPQAPVTPPPVTPPSTAQPPATTPLVATPLQDGGPLKDAGNELLSALSVTYSQYESNFLSPVDSVDTFKIFTRLQEGVGVILKPKHPATLLACDLLGEGGELLSQTQASGPGQHLAFQTSPFEKNGIIYLQVRDSNLSADSPPTEQREYSLELKPIAVIVPPPPPPTPPPAPTPVEQSKDESLFQLPENFWQYGLAGLVFLVLVLSLIVLIRRRRRKNERI